MKNRNNFICIIFSLLFVLQSKGQENDTTNYGVEILTKVNATSVELRWAPTTKETWLTGNQEGYIIERRKLDGQGWKQLANVVPYSLEEWKAKTDTTNAFVSVAAQALLSKPLIKTSGKAPFQAYLQASQEGDNKYAYAMMAAEYNKQAAQGLALAYQDEDIKSGDIVQYRVYVKYRKEPFSGDTAYIRVYTNEISAAKQVVQTTVQPGDGEIVLFWNRALNNVNFSGYFIEKSVDGGKTFLRLNRTPYVKTFNDEVDDINLYSFKDTNVINYKPYQYRIIGITPFADESVPSEIIKTEGIDLTGPIPPTNVTVTELDEAGKFSISWEASTNAPDHAGFYVGKSPTVTGPFEKLTKKPLGKNERTFKDPNPTPYSCVYYAVFAVDDKGNENLSDIAVGIKTDSIPPATPIGCAGSVDSLGVVMLTWQANTEDDLQGYRIYRGNNTQHEYIQLTSEPIPLNLFFDTIPLSTLTKNIYYQVVAVDMHYNPSDYSAPINIQKPDYIAPASPTFINYSVTDTAVRLHWKTSPSSDAVFQVLYRQKEDENWQIVQQFENNTDTFYVDRTAAAGHFYTYTLVAVDDAGLYSERANPLRLKIADSGRRPGVTNVGGAFDDKCKCFVFSWDFTSDQVHHFVVYRNENNTGLQAIATLKSGTKEYVDSNIFGYENGYEYAIKVKYADGGEGAISPIVTFGKGK